MINQGLESHISNLPISHQEGVQGSPQSEVNGFLDGVTDVEILREIDDRLASSERGTEGLRLIQSQNRDYYMGDQLKSFDLLHWQLPSVENRIWLSTEVLIPMATANPGDPDIHCLAWGEGQETEITYYVEACTSVLMYDYDVVYNLKDKIREILRHWFMYQVGVGKFRYNKMTGQPTFDVVDPRNIILPSKGSPKGWLAEFRQLTLRELLVEFPESKAKLEGLYWTQGGEIPEEILGTIIGCYEYWRDSFVAFKVNDTLLDKRRNPYWDWEGEKRVTHQEAVLQPDGSSIINPIVDTYKFRILDRPLKPYFIFNYFTVDGLEYDNTGYIQQGIPSQDLVNKRKRQITAAADDAGILVASGMGGAGIKKAEFDKYDGSPRSTFWIPDGNPSTIFARLSPAQVSPGMIQDLQDSRQSLDNLFGTSNTTRGEQGPQETATGRTILRNGDINRIAPIAEAVEDFLQKVYMYDLQMRVLFTETDYTVPQVTPSDTSESKNVTFNRNKIPFVKVDELVTIDGKQSMETFMKPAPITLRVRRNSTLPKDPLSEYQRVYDMMKAGIIDPLTALERVGEIDPSGKYLRLLKHQANPASLLSPEKQKELMMATPQITAPVNGTAGESPTISNSPTSQTSSPPTN